MYRLILAAGLVFTTACDTPGPSVPSRSGESLHDARLAVENCAHLAEGGGRSRVAGNYVGGILLGGLILGPIVVASNEGVIRARGEAAAVDRCLAEQGFVRRDLTPQEVGALNRSTPQGRRALLDHLVGGGTLADFGGV